MKKGREFLFLVVLLGTCVSLTGCELLTLPLQAAGAAVGLASDAFSLYQALPLPPPWVFL